MYLPLPTLVTCLALILYFVATARVSLARIRYKIAAPATTGHAMFERTYRVQQNTLEQLVLFLPAFWLFVTRVSPLWGSVLGALWLIGRVVYMVSYERNPDSRGPGFILASVASVTLLIGSLVAAIAMLAQPMA